MNERTQCADVHEMRKPDILTDQINEAPEPLRNYVHTLETDADPSGNIRRALWAEIENAALLHKIEELKLAEETP